MQDDDDHTTTSTTSTILPPAGAPRHRRNDSKDDGSHHELHLRSITLIVREMAITNPQLVRAPPPFPPSASWQRGLEWAKKKNWSKKTNSTVPRPPAHTMRPRGLRVLQAWLFQSTFPLLHSTLAWPVLFLLCILYGYSTAYFSNNPILISPQSATTLIQHLSSTTTTTTSTTTPKTTDSHSSNCDNTGDSCLKLAAGRPPFGDRPPNFRLLYLSTWTF